MSVLPKIQALIERAAHPDTPVEEARTSAVIAAKLIKEHEVRLVEKNRGYPSDGVDTSNPLDVMIDMIFRNRPGGRPWAAETEARRRAAKEAAERAAARAADVAKQRTKKKTRGPKTRRTKQHWTMCPHGKRWPTCETCWPTDFFGNVERRRVWTATCPSYTYPTAINCACCGTKIEPGERMLWVGGESVTFTSPITHERCSMHWASDWCTKCGKRTT